jgi:hypothetical protein
MLRNLFICFLMLFCATPALADTYILYPTGNTVSTTLLSVTDGYVPVAGTDYPAGNTAVLWRLDTTKDPYPGNYQLQTGAIVHTGAVTAPKGPSPSLALSAQSIVP